MFAMTKNSKQCRHFHNFNISVPIQRKVTINIICEVFSFMNKVDCTFCLTLNLPLPLSKLQNFIVQVCNDGFLRKFLFVQTDSFIYTDWGNLNEPLPFTSEE